MCLYYLHASWWVFQMPWTKHGLCVTRPSLDHISLGSHARSYDRQWNFGTRTPFGCDDVRCSRVTRISIVYIKANRPPNPNCGDRAEKKAGHRLRNYTQDPCFLALHIHLEWTWLLLLLCLFCSLLAVNSSSHSLFAKLFLTALWSRRYFFHHKNKKTKNTITRSLP